MYTDATQVEQGDVSDGACQTCMCAQLPALRMWQELISLSVFLSLSIYIYIYIYI